ncbi:ATP-binding protein [Myxococcota bacterium]|nr:ATP-binding protein [Myxococcota bacterium]
MKSTFTQRFRRLSAAFSLGWGAFAIALSVLALISPNDTLSPPFHTIRLGSSTVVGAVDSRLVDGSIEAGDRIVAIDGVPFVGDPALVVGALKLGVPNSYEVIKRDGRRVSVPLVPVRADDLLLPMIAIFHAFMLIVAGIYLAIGSVVWLLRSENPGALPFVIFCGLIACQLSTLVQWSQVPWSWSRSILSTSFIGASVFHLFATYPFEPAWLVRRRQILLLPYLGALVISGAAFVQWGMGGNAVNFDQVSAFYSTALFAVSMVVIAMERQRHGDGDLRDRADFVFYGALVSLAPVALAFVANGLFGVTLPYYIALLGVFLFPFAVAYGLLRRRLLGVRTFAKSSAAYGAATLSITGLFAFFITFADTLVSRLNVSLRWFQFVFLFVAILIFNPLRNRMQALVDRFFDRDRSAYRVAVREISDAMVSMLSVDEITDRILMALTDTMGVEHAMVLLVDDETKMLVPMASRGDFHDEALSVRIASDHPIWRQLWIRRDELSRADFDHEVDPERREACRNIFDTIEAELLVPILYGVDLLGVITVGRKVSRDRLVADDRLLLRTLANQSSIAIENAKAFDEIAKLNETLEARVEERSRELRETQGQLIQSDKMKSLGQLVAGVAHELNNPIGFVHANLQLIDGYVKRLVEGQTTGAKTDDTRDAIEKLLRRSREGTQRVIQIVQDLRTFSRMDQAELQEANLEEEIDRTLALMEPRFRGGIRVERDYAEIPPVRCYPGQLNQVFLNLLMNACDAIESDGCIRIQTRLLGDEVRLVFSDDGPGIPESVKNRIFDPFFTTKAVGLGTGLGLSLSHGIIERHGGMIRIDSEEGRGASFSIEIPLVASEGEV